MSTPQTSKILNKLPNFWIFGILFSSKNSVLSFHEPKCRVWNAGISRNYLPLRTSSTKMDMNEWSLLCRGRPVGKRAIPSNSQLQTSRPGSQFWKVESIIFVIKDSNCTIQGISGIPNRENISFCAYNFSIRIDCKNNTPESCTAFASPKWCDTHAVLGKYQFLARCARSAKEGTFSRAGSQDSVRPYASVISLGLTMIASERSRAGWCSVTRWNWLST